MPLPSVPFFFQIGIRNLIDSAFSVSLWFYYLTAENAEKPVRCAGSPRCSNWRDTERKSLESTPSNYLSRNWNLCRIQL